MKKINLFIILLLFLSKSLFSTYKLRETEHFNIFIHDSLNGLPEAMDKKFLEQAYKEINSFLSINPNKEKKIDLFITQFNINEDSTIMPTTSFSKPLFLNLSDHYLKNFDIHDTNATQFIFYYELTKYLYNKKIKEDFSEILHYVDTLYPVRNRIKDMLIPSWLLEGIALHAAAKFNPESKNNIRLLNLYANHSAEAINNSYVKGEDVRYSIKPARVFYYLKQNDFYLPYLFRNFLSFYEKKFSYEKLVKCLEDISKNLKNENSLQNPLLNFSKEIDKKLINLMDEWWSSFNFKNNKEKYNLNSLTFKWRASSYNGIIYFLEVEKDGVEVVSYDPSNKNTKVLTLGKDIEDYSILNGNILTSRFEVNASEDSFLYSLYEGSNLKKENFDSRFIATSRGIFYLKREGMKEALYLNEREIVPVSYGLKFEKFSFFNDILYFSASQNSAEPIIYSLDKNNKVKMLCKGRSPIYHNGSIYFTDIYKNKMSLFRLDKNNNIYLVYDKKESLEPVTLEKKLFLLVYNTNSYDFIEIEEVKGRKIKEASTRTNFEPIDYDKDLKEYAFSYHFPYIGFDIFKATVSFNYEYSRGALVKERLFKFAFKFPLESLFKNDLDLKDKINPRGEFEFGYPIFWRNFRLYFIPKIEAVVDVKGDQIKYNNLKTGFSLSDKYKNIEILAKAAIRNDFGKLGLIFNAETTYLNFKYFYGKMSEEYNLISNYNIDLREDRSKEEAHFFAIAAKFDFEIPLNWNMIDYKMKINEIVIRPHIYYLQDINNKEPSFAINPEIGLNFNIFYSNLYLSYGPYINLKWKDFNRNFLKNLKDNFKFYVSYSLTFSN